MANSNAKAKTVLSFIDALGNSLSSSLEAAAPYQASAATQIDIPDATAAATSFSVSFGSIAAPTMIILSNKGNQDLDVTISGGDTPLLLVAGGLMILGGPTATDVSSVSVATTDIQSGEGKVSAFVFGDPVVA
ncbi:MAG: hypothetical protein H6718_04120 [Polyangiaceae bacterium]|nr:hypothetical protein [Polyangiaceae bacterium]